MATEWKTLGEISSLCNYGYTAKATQESKGIVFLRITDITHDGNLKKDGFKRIPYDENVVNKYRLEDGDIVIARSGSVGLNYLFDKNDGEMIFASYLIRFRIDKGKVNPKYVKYILHSSLFYNFVNLKKRKVAQTNINATELKQFKFPVPSLDTQNKLVAIMEKAERIRCIRTMANKNYDDIIKSLFFEIFGNPLTNPKNFDKEELGKLCIISMGGTPNTKEESYYKGGDINWMKSGDIKNDFVYSIPQKITESGFKSCNAKLYNSGDVVIALNGQGKTRGTTAILGVDTTSNQSVASLSPHSQLNSVYLHFNLKYRYKELRDLTGDKQRSGLNLTILRNLNIALPPIDLQDKFALAIQKMQSFKEKQNNSTLEVNEIYHSLIEGIINKAS